ncbi:MAG: acyl-CoA dehydrogenase [Acidimicrobiales bacterium]
MTAPVASTYDAPVEDIMTALDVAGLPALLRLPDFAHLERETVSLAVKEFGRFASEVLEPTDAPGDAARARFDPSSGRVVTPPGFGAAYRQYVQGGWGALQFPERSGGGGFPSVVAVALQEMFASANTSLSINPVLTQAAAELVLRLGTDRQRQFYLPPLLSGRWCGTMELTEAGSGSDLSELKALAEPQPDGSWRLSGTKIFITWGEHDLADNIVHVVLARTPGAPAGTRGLSVFLVPKVAPGPAGELGVANSLRCTRIEEKLGIHASPTCVMRYDGAYAELVGEVHGGLRAMLTMMNLARLSIGAEGSAIAERAYQQARRYAASRLQGRRPLAPGRSAIIEHPDVARMLLKMRTLTLASRLVVFTASAYGDQAVHGADEAARERGGVYCQLLTPVAKAWATDNGFLVSSLGVQVHGGMGYVEETGIAQRLRDARIGAIYEGTNGIQALDLVARKLPRDGGRWARELLDEITATVSSDYPDELAPAVELLAEAQGALSAATSWLLERGTSCPDDVLAGASAYLELAGVTVGGWLMVKRALAVLPLADGFATAAGEAHFFATESMVQAGSLLRQVTAGAGRLAALTGPRREISPGAPRP